ncbi:MAG: transcription termination/antitermination protein NusA [Acidobacteria bacterium]|nr:transcription termination/antitermination protein NusA [Acidobacteriota bacterium]MBI3473756.1 transcription termination/antitermination protein NusA [Candidatus Solibacter usitatus]
MASIYQSIELLSKEKGIDTQIVLDAVKDALLVAARKHYRTNEDYIAELNEKTGSIDLYVVKKVVETVENPAKEMTLAEARKIDQTAEIDKEVRIGKPTDMLGRISAQTAKQVIFQKVREAERETIYQEYSGRVGELVNCTVKRMEGSDLVVDLGKTEARLPKKEQSRLESYSVGDRIRCVIKIVDKSSKTPGLVVSRAAPELVMRLFEQEVPEIYDSTIVIKGCAREAGERTKIAVQSRDRDVDSVGACVGMKGMRVQSIIRELRGEKIDIIEFSEDPVVFATHALSPAKITRVAIMDTVEKHMEVIVDDSQLSLAIGKKGQNVRLAAKLLGWRVDIKSEEEKRQEVETAMAALVAPGAPVSVLVDYGLADKLAEKLVEAGIGTVEKLGSMTPEQLEEIPGVEPKMVEKIQQAVNSYYAQFEATGEAAGEAAVQESEEPAVEAIPAAADEAPEVVETQGAAEAGTAGEAPAAADAPEWKWEEAAATEPEAASDRIEGSELPEQGQAGESKDDKQGE